MSLYYEAHVTLEPVLEDHRRGVLSLLASKHSFKLAELLMQKRAADTPERSKYDTFMTGRDTHFSKLSTRLMDLIVELKAEGFKVWRYKIEDTMVDSKIKDSWGLITKE